MTIKWKGNR